MDVVLEEPRVFRQDPEAARAEEEYRDEIEAETHKLIAGRLPDEETEAHFDNLPPRYFRTVPADEIVEDIELVHDFFKQQVLHENRMLDPAVIWKRDPDRGYPMSAFALGIGRACSVA